VSGPFRVVDGPAGSLRVYTSPSPGSQGAPALFVSHELPLAEGAAPEVGRTFPALADRLSHESGWAVVTATFRGAGASNGDFSIEGWLEDLRFLLDLEVEEATPRWLAGFGLGGALALRVAAEDERVRGVACLGTTSDPSAFAVDPEALLERCRRSGVVRRRDFPPDLERWAIEFAELDPVAAAAALGRRSLLVVHGAEDREVPALAALELADAAIGPVDLRIVPGAGHLLRADPRVVATLMGWLERQR